MKIVDELREMLRNDYGITSEAELDMLTPLVNAEKILKDTMGRYSMEQERKRRELEEKMRRQAQEEADRKLAEAIAAEESGDKDRAAEAMLDAQMIDQVSRSSALEIERPKADGTYVTKDWEIVEIDQNAVPLAIQGVCIRPVDTSAVMRLIRASKGSIQIPAETKKYSAAHRTVRLERMWGGCKTPIGRAAEDLLCSYPHRQIDRMCRDLIVG